MWILLGLLVVLAIGAVLLFAIPKGRATGGPRQPRAVVEEREAGRD